MASDSCADAVAQMTSLQTGDLQTGFSPVMVGLGFAVVASRGPDEMVSAGTFGPWRRVRQAELGRSCARDDLHFMCGRTSATATPHIRADFQNWPSRPQTDRGAGSNLLAVGPSCRLFRFGVVS